VLLERLFDFFDFRPFFAVALTLLSGLGKICMIEALFNSPNYVAGKRVLDAIALRQEAIASNIANLETPGYKRVDLAPSFQSELQRACASGNASQLAALKPSLAMDPTAVPNSRDGNTVNLESEMMHLQQNTVAHAVQAELITSTFEKLKLAISGK
jgi:flagellar basal-body rod protein FlgB